MSCTTHHILLARPQECLQIFSALTRRRIIYEAVMNHNTSQLKHFRRALLCVYVCERAFHSQQASALSCTQISVSGNTVQVWLWERKMRHVSDVRVGGRGGLVFDRREWEEFPRLHVCVRVFLRELQYAETFRDDSSVLVCGACSCGYFYVVRCGGTPLTESLGEGGGGTHSQLGGNPSLLTHDFNR